MEIIPTLLLAALVWKFIDFLKMARAGDLNGVVTQLIVWVSGLGAVFLMASTGWADAIDVGGQALSQLDSWDKVVIGLEAASLTSASYDVKKAIDGSDSAKTPQLVPDHPEE